VTLGDVHRAYGVSGVVAASTDSRPPSD
jgi:hypothetical protein